MNAAVLLFFDIGGGELFVIMLFVLIFFGADKIPDLARGLGKGIREFKDASTGIRRELEKETKQIKESVDIEKDINDLTK
ncbi:MAG: twin-arginine translocase TatA/TatE family subunit [Bacteroidia bacterium]|nr:twin-arginine translocase TatA/TatE family subunit [Bacteroidia bacterium]